MKDSFLICRLPGENRQRRYEFTASGHGEFIFGDAAIRPWPGTRADAMMPVATVGTAEDNYLSAIEKLIVRLRHRSGKTVIARQICGTMKNFRPIETAEKYFERFPDMFCFLFHTPVTGYWMGASPELLLEVTGCNRARTRALAGTRMSREAGEWDSKNIAEHRFVTDDICSRISALGLYPSTEPCRNLHYGAIEHLCTEIDILSGGSEFPTEALVNAIHPTPAVCGWPRSDAMTDIAEFESFDRQCYGGHITVPTEKGPLIYVILRCVHFDESHWCVFSGSGITSDSIPASEWAETQAKAAPLVKLLNEC